MDYLLELYAGDAINAEELEEALLVHQNFQRSEIKIRSAEYHGRLDLEKLSDEDCELKFRFSKQYLSRLANVLGIPEVVTTKQRYRVSGVEGLCILLRRLTYPNRLYDLEEIFGLSSSYLSVIANTVLHIIEGNKAYLLENLNNLNWLTEERLEYYAQAVFSKGAPFNSCWGFIDGTARPISRPSVNQKDYYSGHKRQHCLKYQSVLSPDGLIINLFGPCEGRRHDAVAGILRESQLYQQLQEKVVFRHKKYRLYGDSGYPIRELLLRPYTNVNLTNQQQEFNTRMSAIRQPVEWGFGKVVNIFAFVDFKKNQKLLLQDVSAMYRTSVLLANCHSCLYGNQTADYFGIQPPTLEEYLQIELQ